MTCSNKRHREDMHPAMGGVDIQVRILLPFLPLDTAQHLHCMLWVPDLKVYKG